MYETDYDRLQPYFGQGNLQLDYIDTDGMIMGMKAENNIRDLRNLEDYFDFSTLDKNHELYINKIEKVIGKFKIETPKIVWIEEFVCLRSNASSVECEDKIESKNKLKGVSKSQPKHIKFEKKTKKCLDGEEYQRDCNNYILRSINHEMHLQELKKINIIYFR